MYTPVYNKRRVLKFKQFNNHGYSLFSVLGKEVIIGVLSVATLRCADAAAQTTSVAVEPDTTWQRTVEMNEVNVTGTRAPLTVRQQARMVTVLSRSDIAAAPVQSVNDLLKYATGVDVRQKGPLGALTDVSIRGGNSEQVAILLNGINICDPQTGHNAMDLPVSLGEIERIEVLEGPAARVYGTSSLLGAINIVTRIDAKSGATAHLEGGSYGYLAAGAHGNISSQRWRNQLSATYLRSDGYQRSKAGSLNSDYRTAKAFYQGQYDDPNVALRWQAGLSSKDYGSNTYYSARFDDQFEHTLKTFLSLKGENRSGLLHFRPAIYWNHQEDRFELIRGSEAKVPYNYHRTEVFGLNLNAYFDWTLGRTAFGAEMRNEDILSTNLGDPLDRKHAIHGTERFYTNGLNRTNLQLFLEHNIALGPLFVSAGLTAAKNTQADMDWRVYPGLDVSLRLDSHWQAFANFNTSLRMPSFTELYYSVGGHKADRHLKPEELSAVEGGLALHQPRNRGKGERLLQSSPQLDRLDQRRRDRRDGRHAVEERQLRPHQGPRRAGLATGQHEATAAGSALLRSLLAGLHLAQPARKPARRHRQPVCAGVSEEQILGTGRLPPPAATGSPRGLSHAAPHGKLP